MLSLSVAVTRGGLHRSPGPRRCSVAFQWISTVGKGGLLSTLSNSNIASQLIYPRELTYSTLWKENHPQNWLFKGYVCSQKGTNWSLVVPGVPKYQLLSKASFPPKKKRWLHQHTSHRGSRNKSSTLTWTIKSWVGFKMWDPRLKIWHWKTTFLIGDIDIFKGSIFHCYVRLPECKSSAQFSPSYSPFLVSKTQPAKGNSLLEGVRTYLALEKST